LALPPQGPRQPPVRRFYGLMALACAWVVVIGFGPSFYLKPIVAAPPLDWLLVTHGLVFTAWIALFVAQTKLVARGRIDLHRRLGAAGAVLAAVMVVMGVDATIDAVHRGTSPDGAPAPLTFFAIPFFAIVTFALFVTMAVGLRHRAEAHKRLMLMATVTILGAAVARMPFDIAAFPPVFFALTDLFVVAGVVHDLRTRGRVHPAYVWGGLFILASQAVQLAIMHTEGWHGFARWMAG